MAGKQIHMAIVYFTEIEQGKLLKLHLSSHGYLQGLLLEWNQTENGLVRKYRLSKEYNETIDIVMYVSQKDLITYFYYLNTDSHLKAPPSLWLFQNRLFSFDINVNKHYLFSIKRRIR